MWREGERRIGSEGAGIGEGDCCWILGGGVGIALNDCNGSAWDDFGLGLAGGVV